MVKEPDELRLEAAAPERGTSLCEQELIHIPGAIQPHGATPVAMTYLILNTFSDVSSRVELCERAVRGLKAVTGYDRVMAYRFAEDGHGEVIAEALQAGLEPYLGFRYPAADIPPQARRQYLRQRVGAVADSSYQPVALLCDVTRDDGVPLDLTTARCEAFRPTTANTCAT